MTAARFPLTTPHPRAARWLVALAALQIVIGLLAVVAWRADHGSAAVDLDAVTAVAIPPVGLEQAYPVAEGVARTWRADAALVSASLQVDWPWDVIPGDTEVALGGWATFVFASESAGGTLSVAVDRISGRAARTETIAWAAGPPAPITPPGTFPTGSLRAVALAEADAGRAFRTGCPSSRHLTRVALLQQPSGQATAPPAWLVTYHDSRTPDLNALEFRISVAGGEILSVVDQAPPCEDP